MGWLSPLRKIFGSREEKATSWLDELWSMLSTSYATRSGQAVNMDRALQVSTVLACGRVTAEDVAANPMRVVRETDSGYSAQAPEHDLYDILERRPNDVQNGFELRETMTLQAVLQGNAYAFINRINGRVHDLTPFEPGQVTPTMRPNGQLIYRATTASGQRDLLPEQIWHLRGPAIVPVQGVDIVKVAREAIGLAIATEEAHASLHRNGLQTTGVVSIEGNLDDTQHKKLELWIEQNRAKANRFKPLILDRGAKFMSQVMSGVDAQHIETRRFQIEEICRAMRVIPIMVGHSDKIATYASAEQMFIAHNNNIGKWCRRLDKSGEFALLSPQDYAKGYRLRHQINALMYADTKAKAAWYTALYMIGAITPNEIRSFEHMKPYAEGDQFRVPVNMIDPATEAQAVTSELRKMLAGELGDLLKEGLVESKLTEIFSRRRRVFTTDEDIKSMIARLFAEPGSDVPTVH